MIANYLGIPYCEKGISYCDQVGSKLNIVMDSIQMARDYVLIRLLFLLSIWRKDDSDKIWERFLCEWDVPAPSAYVQTRLKRE